MDKCWFVLKQAHYPAPENVHLNRASKPSDGPLLLGHVIPNLSSLDQVINSSGPVSFPRGMRIWATTLVDLHWDNSTSVELGVGAKIEGPIVTTPGVAVGSDIKLEFRKTVSNFAQFERLDTHIIQPSKTYVESCLASMEVANHVSAHTTLGNWKVFMITGLMIARGGSTVRKESELANLGVSMEVKASDNLTAQTGSQALSSTVSQLAGKHVTDFVWAVRLLELKKTVLSSEISQRTVGKGATFSADGNEVDLTSIARDVGMTGWRAFQHDLSNGESDFILIPSRNE